MRLCIFENFKMWLTVYEPVYYTVIPTDTCAHVTKGGIVLANKTVRELKVSARSGYGYNPVPSIVLKGKWLMQTGFQIGDYIKVSCEDGRIIITPDKERAALEEAKAAFMDREMKILQKRFDAEK